MGKNTAQMISGSINVMANLLDRGERFRSGFVNLNGVIGAITNPEIFEKIHEIELDDQKVKVREIAEAAAI